MSIERSIMAGACDLFARLRVTDDIRNTGAVATTAALLCHVNIGPPVAVPGSVITVEADEWRASAPAAEVPDPFVLPPVANRLVKAVFEQPTCTLAPIVGRKRSSHDGFLDCASRWPGDGTTLPHVNQ